MITAANRTQGGEVAGDGGVDPAEESEISRGTGLVALELR